MGRGLEMDALPLGLWGGVLPLVVSSPKGSQPQPKP